MDQLEKLTPEEMRRIYGGRDVYKVDFDNDGNWDLKIVVRNNGKVKAKTRWM